MSDTPTPAAAEQPIDPATERKKLAEQILERLNRSGSSALTLLGEYKTRAPENQLMWKENPHLYQAFTVRLIEEDSPAAALSLADERQRLLREGAARDAPDTIPEGYPLRFSLALAAARGGSTARAEALLAPLQAIALRPERVIKDMPTELRVNVVALVARLLKDRARQDPNLARLSAEAYLEAANLPGATDLPNKGTFPLINAATMWRSAAHIEGNEEYAAKSRVLAAEVISRIESLVEAAVEAGDYWLPATLGEAYVLVGRHEDAVKWYVRAVSMARAKHKHGDMVAMGSNLMRLVEAKATEKPEWIEEHIGTVVVFAGHMIDSPDRLQKGLRPRFPNSPGLVQDLARVIGAKLAEMKARVGFCSLACGSDILFAEAMLKREAELHIVLPFDKEDFERTSVDFGLKNDDHMQSWLDRFRWVLRQVPKDNIHYATTEPFLGTQELFEFVNTFTQGLAVLRARQRIGTPKALVVLEEEKGPAVGGTQHFRDTWERTPFRPAEMIDLRAVRGSVVPQLPRVEPKALPELLGAELKRPIRALLFADVAGFSGIEERCLPKFLSQYTTLLKRAFASDGEKSCEYVNTWGDGLYMVFDNVARAAGFALTLLELASNTEGTDGFDWSPLVVGGEGAPIRVALHCGPVYEVPGIFTAHTGFYGQHVNRTARIEPVTLPGCAYASEQFAAHLTISAPDQFLCEFVSIRDLAKNYDRCPLYRVTRAPSRGGR